MPYLLVSEVNEMNRFEMGFAHGYEAFQEGDESRFYCSNDPIPAVRFRSTNAVCDPEDLDYARGYIDGFMKAESDKH